MSEERDTAGLAPASGERDALLSDSLLALGPHLAHDLRSPLNNLVIQLELLRRLAPADDETAVKLRQRQEVLEREVGRLSSSVERLLALLVPAKSPRVWDVRELMEELVELCSGMARHSGRHVILGSSSRAQARTDRNAVRTALLYALTRALSDAVGNGRGESLRLIFEAGDGQLRFSVEQVDVAGVDEGSDVPDEAASTKAAVHAPTLPLEGLGGSLTRLRRGHYRLVVADEREGRD